MGFNGALFYADCGMNINPNADQLAEIAVCTARTSRTSQAMNREWV